MTYFEQADKNPHALDAGQGLAGLPGSILQMTGNPDTVIDPAQVPVDPTTCKPVYPHSYLKVNTVFEVARAAGLRTAWSDKHPTHEVLDGPSRAPRARSLWRQSDRTRRRDRSPWRQTGG